MAGEELPGFYWDPEKKKYFRIQPNHVAPSGSQYSKEAVKKRKLDIEQQKRRRSIENRVRKERVRKSRWLSNTCSRVSTVVGDKLVPGFVMKSFQGQIFASQLQQRYLCNVSDGMKAGSVASFVRHEETGALLIGTNTEDGYTVLVCPPFAKQPESYVYDMSRDSGFMWHPYRLSSLSMSDSGHYLITMHSGSGGKSAFITGSMDLMDNFGAYTFQRQFFPTRLEDNTTLWCSAARPGPESPIFAVGASDGLYTIDFISDSITRRGMPIPSDKPGPRRAEMDLLAVEWLSPTVIASGSRNSVLYLTDLRSGGHSKRIRHPSSIEQIKRVDDCRLVLAGYQSLYMYDLRFAKYPTIETPRNRHSNRISSQPYLIFEGYDREISNKFDLSLELGLIASATRDQKIKLHSLADGSIVPSPVSRDSSNLGDISHVLFDNPQYSTRPRLLVGRESVIQEWTW